MYLRTKSNNVKVMEEDKKISWIIKKPSGRSHLSPVCPQKGEKKKENEGLKLNYASIVSPLWRAHSGAFF